MGDERIQPLPETINSACSNRRKRLRTALANEKLDALVVSGEKDIQYLTGFVGHDSLLVVTLDTGPSSAIIISDSRYDEFLEPWRKARAAEIIIGKRHWLNKTIQALCNDRKFGKVGIQAEHMTIADREMMSHFLGEERLSDTKGLISKLRMKKDDLEISTIEWAISVQQEALAAALDELTIGMKELDFCAVLEFEMKTRGAAGASFPPIIATGANSSIIHYMTGHTTIGPGTLLVDWGASIDGYCSDMTRTFGVLEFPTKIREIYSIVLDAQKAVIDAIKPGMICSEVDAIARNMIIAAGYGENFGHGLGHGLGMDVHEIPFFNDLEKESIVEPGMLMTVEPGIYLPGVGGVRIEDDVLVTEDGCRVLSDWPKGLDDALVEPAVSETHR